MDYTRKPELVTNNMAIRLRLFLDKNYQTYFGDPKNVAGSHTLQVGQILLIQNQNGWHIAKVLKWGKHHHSRPTVEFLFKIATRKDFRKASAGRYLVPNLYRGEYAGVSFV
jgi:hypothetical protein